MMLDIISKSKNLRDTEKILKSTIMLVDKIDSGKVYGAFYLNLGIEESDEFEFDKIYDLPQPDHIYKIYTAYQYFIIDQNTMIDYKDESFLGKCYSDLCVNLITLNSAIQLYYRCYSNFHSYILENIDK